MPATKSMPFLARVVREEAIAAAAQTRLDGANRAVWTAGYADARAELQNDSITFGSFSDMYDSGYSAGTDARLKLGVSRCEQFVSGQRCEFEEGHEGSCDSSLVDA
jgi:hypothetical protein